ncbi:MAG: ATP synthase F1 subunit delta [candidate division KSB1 bacterium]|jgi:F-type H+-transporting ATPase subunit delta|nr:ATP synthase F1 subunit delta [candidate division KSB1 bacterium]
MKTNSIARNYAKAFYDHAREAGIVENLIQEMDAFASMIQGNENIQLLLTRPNVKGREDIIDALFGGYFPRVLVNFVKIVVKNKRYELLLQIFDDVQRRYELDQDILRVETVTAVPLGDDELGSITADLKRLFGKEPLIENRVDESIVAGIRIFVNGKVYDSSLEARLQKIRSDLLKN